MKRVVKKKKPAKKVKQDLTEKQKLFCLYYIKNFNATQAYKKAFGCRYSTALTNGCALLGNTRIRKEITRLKAEKKKSLMLNENDVIDKWVRLAFADLSDYVEWGRKEIEGEFGPFEINDVRLKESNDVDADLLSEVKQGREGTTVKLKDSIKALEWVTDNLFDLNQANKHKNEIELKKLDLEKERLILLQNKSGQQETVMEDDGFLDALKGSAAEVWTDDSEED